MSYAKFMALMGKYLFITRLIAFENKCKFVDFSWFAYDEFPIAKPPIFAVINVIILKSLFSAPKNIAYSIYFHFAKPNIGMCMLPDLTICKHNGSGTIFMYLQLMLTAR